MASVKKDNANGNTKPRLLLVESNDLIRDIFKDLFERSGYYIVAVDTARECSVAVVISKGYSNNKMPQAETLLINTINFATRIRNEFYNIRTIFLFFTKILYNALNLYLNNSGIDLAKIYK